MAKTVTCVTKAASWLAAGMGVPVLGLLERRLELRFEGVAPSAGDGSGGDQVVDVLEQELDLLRGRTVRPEDCGREARDREGAERLVEARGADHGIDRDPRERMQRERHPWKSATVKFCVWLVALSTTTTRLRRLSTLPSSSARPITISPGISPGTWHLGEDENEDLSIDVAPGLQE